MLYRVGWHEVDLSRAKESDVIRGLVLQGDKLLDHIPVKGLLNLQTSCEVFAEDDPP